MLHRTPLSVGCQPRPWAAMRAGTSLFVFAGLLGIGPPTTHGKRTPKESPPTASIALGPVEPRRHRTCPYHAHKDSKTHDTQQSSWGDDGKKKRGKKNGQSTSIGYGCLPCKQRAYARGDSTDGECGCAPLRVVFIGDMRGADSVRGVIEPRACPPPPKKGPLGVIDYRLAVALSTLLLASTAGPPPSDLYRVPMHVGKKLGGCRPAPHAIAPP